MKTNLPVKKAQTWYIKETWKMIIQRHNNKAESSFSLIIRVNPNTKKMWVQMLQISVGSTNSGLSSISFPFPSILHKQSVKRGLLLFFPMEELKAIIEQAREDLRAFHDELKKDRQPKVGDLLEVFVPHAMKTTKSLRYIMELFSWESHAAFVKKMEDKLMAEEENKSRLEGLSKKRMMSDQVFPINKRLRFAFLCRFFDRLNKTPQLG
jgi:hypothetical protein